MTLAGIPEREGRMLDLPSGPVWPWELAVPITLVGSQGDGGIPESVLVPINIPEGEVDDPTSSPARYCPVGSLCQ